MENIKHIQLDDICDFSNQRIISKIGKGSTSIVYQVTIDNINMACKVINLNIAKRNDIIDEITRSYYFGDKYSDYFMNVYGYSYCDNIIGIDKNIRGYLLFMELGVETLHNRILREHIFTFREIYDILFNIISALKILYDNGFLYLDLHDENIMLTSDGTYKLIDLGYLKKSNNWTNVYFDGIITNDYKTTPENGVLLKIFQDKYFEISDNDNVYDVYNFISSYTS